jgi:hypothetical protein
VQLGEISPFFMCRRFLAGWLRLDTPSGCVTGQPFGLWTRVHEHMVHRTNATQPRGAESAATRSTAVSRACFAF